MTAKFKDDLAQVFQKYPGLRVGLQSSKEININGCIKFNAKYLDFDEIEDKYYINILIPYDFPFSLPTVIETRQRIPRETDRHVFKSGALCLASKLLLKINIREGKTVFNFIDNFLVPFLYANSYYEKYSKYPWGELEHGYKGLANDYMRMFNLNSISQLKDAFHILTLSSFNARKAKCPCGCKKRFNNCVYKDELKKFIGKLTRDEYKIELNECKKYLDKERLNVV